MEVVTVCSFKGGTAKTSTILHLGVSLAKFFHKRVLLVDFDAQANLTTGIGLSSDQFMTMVPVLQGEKPINDVIQPTAIDGLDTIAANVYLDGVEATGAIVNDLYGHERLRKALSRLDYDYVFIDTPPSLGWLTQSAFFASQYSLICSIPEPYSVLALNRLQEYHEQIRENHPLQIIGVVLSFWDERGATNAAFVAAIEQAFPDKLFQTKIRRDIAVSRSILKGKSVFDAYPNSRVARDYEQLASEFFTRIETKEVAGVGYA